LIIHGYWQRRGTRWGRPFRNDRLASLKEHKQVGCPVEINVYDGSFVFVRNGIEGLDQIDSVVEVAIRLAAHERSAVVVFVDIGAAIEVRVDRDVCKPALAIVPEPRVGPTIAVAILGTNLTAEGPQRHGRGCGARHGAQATQQRTKRPSWHRPTSL
jgi:hypothetical protein